MPENTAPNLNVYPMELSARDRYLRLALHGRVHGELGFPNPPPLPQPPPQIPRRIPTHNGPSSPVPSALSRDSQAPVTFTVPATAAVAYLVSKVVFQSNNRSAVIFSMCSLGENVSKKIL